MREKKDYIGVILAAGHGRRMVPFSESYPKPLLPVCNKPIIQHHIEIMKSLGISELIILVGHKGFEISKVLGDGSHLGVSLRYIEQTSMLGIAHAVGRLEPHIDRPFLLLLGDIFFVPGNLESIFARFEEQGGGAVLGTKEEFDPLAIRRNYAIQLNTEGYATRVIEKPRHATNRLKGVGIYLFDLPIFDAIRRTPRTAMRDEYEITDSIQVMIQDGYPVRPSNCVIDDINLTVPADLLRCNLMHAAQVPRERLIGPNHHLNEQAQIRNSIIGANVTVKHPIRIANSLVFDNCCVDSVRDLEHFIVTPETMVDCNQGLVNGEPDLWAKATDARA
ncbi:MAG: sugar phosphate nucleotidyltransferase [Candidatus Acidiferrum sp.]